MTDCEAADHSDFDDSEATNESTAQKLARVKFAKVVDVNGLHEGMVSLHSHYSPD